MAHLIRQDNYNKEPTAEQRKVFVEAFEMPATAIPTTRIDAHLKIRELLGYGLGADAPRAVSDAALQLRAKLKAWQQARKLKRAARRAALVAAGLSPIINGR